MRLLVGSVLLRPYVFLFLAAFLAAGVRDLGPRRTALFLAWVWPLAFLAEFSSTRTGFPFGLYHYTEATRGRELFIANVPFFDSLSFTFLAYASFCLARVASVASRAVKWPKIAVVKWPKISIAVLSGLFMMLLDVVIDPLAVRGERWFLGRIFWYPDGGPYFGVPLSNFAGWLAVGAAGVGGYLALAGLVGDRRVRGDRPWPGVGLYYGVLAFNLAVTAWIGEWRLLTAGTVLHALIAVAILSAGRSGGGGAPSRS